MILAMNNHTGYIFTSSPIRMMSSSVAMEILCITNIDHISSKRKQVLKTCCKHVRLLYFFIKHWQKYLKCTVKYSDYV